MFSKIKKNKNKENMIQNIEITSGSIPESEANNSNNNNQESLNDLISMYNKTYKEMIGLISPTNEDISLNKVDTNRAEAKLKFQTFLNAHHALSEYYLLQHKVDHRICGFTKLGNSKKHLTPIDRLKDQLKNHPEPLLFLQLGMWNIIRMHDAPRGRSGSALNDRIEKFSKNAKLCFIIGFLLLNDRHSALAEELLKQLRSIHVHENHLQIWSIYSHITFLKLLNDEPLGSNDTIFNEIFDKRFRKFINKYVLDLQTREELSGNLKGLINNKLQNNPIETKTPVQTIPLVYSSQMTGLLCSPPINNNVNLDAKTKAQNEINELETIASLVNNLLEAKKKEFAINFPDTEDKPKSTI